MRSYIKYFGVVIGIIIIDLLTKLYVHFNIPIGNMGEVNIFGNWFKIHYTLNPGMAFGIEFGTPYGKLLLTLLRMTAIVLMCRYLWKWINSNKTSLWQLWGMVLVLAGAIGNAIDGTFYGVLLQNSPKNAPMKWFYGQVIDMFYIDIWEGYLPSWIPGIGGVHLSLWPVFNIADSVICIGVGMLFLWQKKYAKKYNHPS